MADAPERPTSVTTSLPPPPVAVSEEPYRALSLLALAAFAIAVLYTAMVLLGGVAPLLKAYPRLIGVLILMAPLAGIQVALLRKQRGAAALASHAGLGLVVLACVLGIGGLLAFSGSNPWGVLEGWGWGLVAAALLLGWMAHSRIAASEGTLTGTWLANWAVTLALFFGLVYGAYWLANSFATAGQAQSRGNEYLDMLSQHNTDPEAIYKAFFMTLPVRRRPASNFRLEAESVHNQDTTDPRGAQPGPFSRFFQQQYVRMLALPGTRFRFARIDSKSLERGGYKVELVYNIESPTGDYELLLGTIGEDTDVGGVRRRQWHVDVTSGRLLGPTKQSPEQLAMERTFNSARALATEWTMKVKTGQVLLAYLDTQEPTARRGLVGDAVLLDPGTLALTGLPFAGALGATGPSKTLRDGLLKYRDGAVLDTAGMWSPKEHIKKGVVQEITTVLAGAANFACDINVSDTTPPGYRVDGDTAEFAIPVRINTFIPAAQKPRFSMEGEVVVTGPAKAAPTALSPYKVTKLRLARGKVAPEPTRQ